MASHTHTQPHTHTHADAYAEANKELFDNFANTYEDLALAHDRARAIAGVAREAYLFNPERTVAMEFACGTGLVTRELVPFTKRIVGVDISSGSIDKFNENAMKHNIPNEKIQGHCLELTGKEGELDGQKFDVIICSQAYHHFGSIDNITRMLGSFLKPGGALLVVDFMDHHDTAEIDVEEIFVGTAEEAMKMPKHKDVHHAVPHVHGIAKVAMRGAVDKAGLVDFEYKYVFTSFAPDGQKQPFFIVKAVKPISAS